MGCRSPAPRARETQTHGGVHRTAGGGQVQVGELASAVNLAHANDPDRVRVIKLDAETGEAKAQGGATLEGAWYRFDYYDGYFDSAEKAQASGAPTRTWTLRTNEYGVARLTGGDELKVMGDEFYRNIDGAVIAPLGTYVVTEVKAPAGYFLEKVQSHVVRVKLDASTGEVYLEGDVSSTDPNAANADTASKEQVYRGDIEFVKADEATQQRMAGRKIASWFDGAIAKQFQI